MLRTLVLNEMPIYFIINVAVELMKLVVKLHALLFRCSCEINIRL